MSYLGKHAEYYDLFYQDKSYQREAEYVANLIRSRCPDAVTILDLGCGTGLRTLELARQGYQVSGLDQSPAMLAIARRHLLSTQNIPGQVVDFLLGDVANYRSGCPYDAVISLFHVFSYLTTEESLGDAIGCSFDNLRPGGILIFDYWHGPGVLKDPPAVRTRQVENSAISIVRKSTPRHFPDQRLVELTLSLAAVEKETGLHQQMEEKYLLRYWFLDELDRQLENSGFKDIRHYSWLGQSSPEPETWQACTVAVKPIS